VAPAAAAARRYVATRHRNAWVATHGADLGPIGFPLIFGIAFGWVGIVRLRICRSARRAALRSDPHRLQATSSLLRRGRANSRIVFVGPLQPLLVFWSLTRAGWNSSDQPVDADVFGELRPGSVLVVVSHDGRNVAVGRTSRRRRWIR